MQFPTALILAAAAASTTTAAAVLPPLRNVTSESAVLRRQNLTEVLGQLVTVPTETGGMLERRQNLTEVLGKLVARQNTTEEAVVERRQNLTEVLGKLVARQNATEEAQLARRQNLTEVLGKLVARQNVTEEAVVERRQNLTEVLGKLVARRSLAAAAPTYDEAAEVVAFADGACRAGTAAGPAATARASQTGRCVAVPARNGTAAALAVRDLHPEDTSFTYAVYAYATADCRGDGTPVPADVCLAAAADGGRAPWRAWQILVDGDLPGHGGDEEGEERAAAGAVARRTNSTLFGLF